MSVGLPRAPEGMRKCEGGRQIEARSRAHEEMSPVTSRANATVLHSGGDEGSGGDSGGGDGGGTDGDGGSDGGVSGDEGCEMVAPSCPYT